MPMTARRGLREGERSLRVFRFVIFLILIAALSLAAERKIDFLDGTTGNRNEVQRFLRRFREESVVDSLSRYLTDRGFLDNQTTISEPDSMGTIQLRFGPQYVIGKIVIGGDSNDTLLYGATFEQGEVQRIIDSILAGYQSKGNYYVSLVPSRFAKAGIGIDIYLTLRIGPVVTVSRVEYEGINRTSPELIGKYVRIKEGDTLFSTHAADLLPKTDRIDFLGLSGPPLIVPDMGYQSASVHYQFIESKPFHFEGAGGYVPEGDGYFLWFFDIRGKNIFGGGQKAGLLLDKREKDKSILDFSYGQPVFLLGLGEASLNVHTRDYREGFYEFGINGEYLNDFSDNLRFLTGVGWKNVEPVEASSRGYQSYEVKLGIESARLKDFKNASGKFSLKWEIRYSGRHYRGGGGPLERSLYNDTRNELSAEAAPSLGGFLSFYCRLDLKDIESSEKPLPASELFLIGGPANLRGYRNDQFAAQRLAMIRTEPRLFLSRTDYVYPFFDAAYWENRALDQQRHPARTDDFKYGFGGGIKFGSEKLSLRMEFSWGENVKLGEPRLLISIGRQF